MNAQLFYSNTGPLWGWHFHKTLLFFDQKVTEIAIVMPLVNLDAGQNVMANKAA